MIRSALVKLPAHQRKKLLGKPTARIFLGRNLLKMSRGFEISDSQFEKNKAEIRELQSRGEIEVFENGHPYQWPSRKPRPAATPPKPAPAEKPKLEPEVEAKPEPKEEPEEPKEEPTDGPEEVEYTQKDLKGMTNEALLELASDLGIEDEVHHRMVKKELVKAIWQHLK
jgi:type IV secretory pathway VirB10-like protein